MRLASSSPCSSARPHAHVRSRPKAVGEVEPAGASCSSPALMHVAASSHAGSCSLLAPHRLWLCADQIPVPLRVAVGDWGCQRGCQVALPCSHHHLGHSGGVRGPPCRAVLVVQGQGERWQRDPESRLRRNPRRPTPPATAAWAARAWPARSGSMSRRPTRRAPARPSRTTPRPRKAGDPAEAGPPIAHLSNQPDRPGLRTRCERAGTARCPAPRLPYAPAPAGMVVPVPGCQAGWCGPPRVGTSEG